MLPPGIFQQLNLDRFVALDLETTGLNADFDDIIEFGAVRYIDGLADEELSFFVKPGSFIPEHITQITGITNDDVKDAQPFFHHLDSVREFIGTDPIVAHNSRFDMQFLEGHARRHHNNYKNWTERNKIYHYFPNPQLDTVAISRLYLPFLASHSLQSLINYFGDETTQSHRALSDAAFAGKIFIRLVEIAVRTGFADVQKLLQILGPIDSPIKHLLENLALFLSNNTVIEDQGIDKENFEVQANYYNIIGEDETPDYAVDSLSPIDDIEAGQFFADGGPLSREFKQYEMRSQQVDMAKAIASAFNNASLQVVEAGTGTGKSMAYMVPALMWAIQNYGEEGRVIISTNTKNLQEQLFLKDIPLLHTILNTPFKAVLLKGKGNYLCKDKWVRVLKDMDGSLTSRERANILPLYFWVAQTQTGDIAENNAFRAERNVSLWTKLIAENNYCPGRKCKFYDNCFLIRARRNAQNAHVVLVNHSLLFSDLAADNAILGEYKNIIFDEAHNIEKTATDYLGHEATYWQFRDLLNKLYTRERTEVGVLAQLKKRIQAGKLTQAHLDAANRNVSRLIDLAGDTSSQIQLFFKELTRILRERTPDNASQYNTRFRYADRDALFEPLKDESAELISLLKMLQKELFELLELFRDFPDDKFEDQRQLQQDIGAQYMQSEALTDNLELLLAGDMANHVYWYELPRRAESFDTRLYAAPLDIGGILNDRLYSKVRTAIFTSATLAVNRRFDYFMNRAGLNYAPEERVERLLLDSPFNYEEQVMLAVPSFMSDPGSPDYTSQIERLVRRLGVDLKRGTLGLFTSYSMMKKVWNEVRHDFEREDIDLFVQGEHGSRHSLLRRFKENKPAFLFGTDSFWEGVDIPGDALQLVLITRLPFDVPSDPVLESRSELIRMQGGNPFMELSMPEAVIRFRQGFGRLIRSQADFGAVMVLDTRVIKKMYGRIFLQSLPVKSRIIASEEELWTELKKWFGEV